MATQKTHLGHTLENAVIALMWHFVETMHRPLMLDHLKFPLALHTAQLADVNGTTDTTWLYLVLGLRILQL